MTRADGLWLFITVQFVVMCGLMYDVVLWRFGYGTISDFCQRHIWAAALVVAFKLVGTMGLAFHFFSKNGVVPK